MIHLHQQWFYEPAIDFELKKYQILAYTQQALEQFDRKCLHPVLHELKMQCEVLQQFLNARQDLISNFKKELDNIDFENQKLVYKEEEQPDDPLNELEHIARYAYRKLNYLMDIYRKLESELRQEITITEVGLLPRYRNEGYLLLLTNNGFEVHDFHVSGIYNSHDTFRTISTNHYGTYDDTAFNTPEKIKLHLITENRSMPNPATYFLETQQELPVEETLLPLAKILLSEKLSA